jgi:hypothetical protein
MTTTLVTIAFFAIIIVPVAVLVRQRSRRMARESKVREAEMLRYMLLAQKNAKKKAEAAATAEPESRSRSAE